MTNNDLKIFALGGLHEVGKNCYVLEKNEDIIIVDCGVKFLNNNNLANGTIPDFAYLQANQKKIKGLFITHGHEDHIGGIPYLLRLIPNIPIYGSDFSLTLLQQKLREGRKQKTTIFQDDTVIRTSQFRISFFRVTHSIPGSFGLVIEVLREDVEIEKKLFDFVIRNKIDRVIVSREREKLTNWNLILDYGNGDRKVFSAGQSKDLIPDFSKLRIIDGKDYKKTGKNLINFLITKQDLEDFLFSIRIAITGDFKFDWTEIGERFDLVKLAAWGKKGVSLLLSDSTNAEIPGNTPSEIKVISRLENIITEATARVIITSFASNVYRLRKIIEIAQKTQKKIVLLGSSLLKMMKAIHAVSLWKIDGSIFLQPSAISKTPKKKLIIFCTGSQGEEKAVLSRLAHQNYPGWKIEANDIIVLTSSPIMDNKSNVEKINNKLFALGAKIYENRKEDLLHASGHACQEDLKLMLRLINPTYFMPVHGDFRMLKSHNYLAQELGIPSQNIFVCQNGEVVSGRKNDFFLSGEKISAQPNFVFDNKLVLAEDLNNGLKLRAKMSHSGVVLIILFFQEKVKQFESPCIFTYGFINMEKNKNLISSWKSLIQAHLKNNANEGDWKEVVEKYTESYLLKDWKREKPHIRCLVSNYDK